MEGINEEKIEAIKKYKHQQFVSNILFYSILALTCTILCTSPFWFPSLYTYWKTFFFVLLPKLTSFFFSPKSLFILGNLIVIFLLGESKIHTCFSSSSFSCSLPFLSSNPPSLRKQGAVGENDDEIGPCQDRRDKKKAHSEENEEAAAATAARTEDVEGEEEVVLTTEELKRRADDFIAMVNKQIRLEA